MAYKMKRGVRPPFKMMGSSPYKEDSVPDPDPPKIETPEPVEVETPEPVEVETPKTVETPEPVRDEVVEEKLNPEEIVREKEVVEAPIEEEIERESLSPREIHQAYEEGSLADVKIDPETGEETYEMTRDLPEIKLTDQHVSEANRFKAEQDSIRAENPVIDRIHGNTQEAADTILEAASWHPALSFAKVFKPLKVLDKMNKVKKVNKVRKNIKENRKNKKSWENNT